jgi:hypothetical protein
MMHSCPVLLSGLAWTGKMIRMPTLPSGEVQVRGSWFEGTHQNVQYTMYCIEKLSPELDTLATRAHPAYK